MREPAPEHTPPADRWIAPPRRLVVITADNTTQTLDVGVPAEPDAWMWAPVTDGQQGDWRRGFTTWPGVFGSAGAWLRGEAS